VAFQRFHYGPRDANGHVIDVGAYGSGQRAFFEFHYNRGQPVRFDGEPTEEE
jgi:hypothetical protein